VIVGLILLVLLIFLSPLAVIVAALLFGLSILALIIRAVQRRSLKGWGIAAVASLVLMLTFGAMSEVLYGTGFMGGTSSSERGEVGDVSQKVTTYDYRILGGVTPIGKGVGMAFVETNLESDAELQALCNPLAEELSERYPKYDAILLDIWDPNGKTIDSMAYFTADWAERDYGDFYFQNRYSRVCYP
jgi:hypothetical protein